MEIKLVPIQAPYYEGADLLIAADCVPFAHATFHQDLLAGKVLMIGCPKLDDGQFYVQKLSQIFETNAINSIAIAFMEVPCCMGMVSIVRMAIEASGKDIPAEAVRIGIKGGILNSVALSELPF